MAMAISQQDLQHLEEVVERNRGAAREFWEALATIKAQGLYHLTHDSWEKYLEERWDLSRQWANQQIKLLTAPPEPVSGPEIEPAEPAVIETYEVVPDPGDDPEDEEDPEPESDQEIVDEDEFIERFSPEPGGKKIPTSEARAALGVVVRYLDQEDLLDSYKETIDELQALMWRP